MALINFTKCRRYLNSSSTRRLCSRLAYVSTPFLIAILLIFFLNTLNPNTFNFNTVTPPTYKYDRPFNLSNYNKYIFLADAKDGGREFYLYYKYYLLADEHDGGSHGNIFFRIASVYGIGKQLDRIACLERTFNDKFRSEFNTVFSNLHNYVLLKDCWNDNAKFVDFHNEVWNYIYENTLDQYADEKYIWLNTGVLECPRFFHRFRHEITKMFEFSASFNKEIDGLAKQVFGDDKSPKICAHIRRSDFFLERHPLLPSYEPFTSKALDYLVTKVAREKNLNKVSLLLFNDDANFTNDVSQQVRKNVHVKNIFTTKNFKPIDDMGLAIKNCDYFLLTSSGSTFGWWMAYLLPDEKQRNVYYNSLFFKKRFAYVIKLFREEEFAPPKWNRLVHDLKLDKVFVQDRSIQPILF